MQNKEELENPRMYDEAAAKYRPEKVDLLWIAESPPPVRESEPPRYLYFEVMTKKDPLFRAVMRVMFPDLPIPSQGESKAPLLKAFQAAGVFLIDLCKEPPAAGIRAKWEPLYEKWWPLVKQEIADCDPRRIIIVKKPVCRFVRPRLDEMGLGDRLLTRRDVPFPGSGRQREFHEMIAPLLAGDRRD